MPKIATEKNMISRPKTPSQLSLFVQHDPIRSQLKEIKIDRLTPLEAINILNELKKKAEKD
jgi:cell division protein ZapA (FtsZ GTPase activity inhibitor)